MQSNYGGTEIASALSLVYESLSKPLLRPVAVLLLTDGSAWDVPTCVEHTRSALATLPQPGNASSFIRVFTVGIGNGASSDTCESIARTGGGVAVYVKEGEALVGKCAKLVRAARMPEVKVEVDWRVQDTEAKPGEMLREDDDDDFIVMDNPDKAQASSTTATITTTSLFNDDHSVDHLSTGPSPRPNPTLPPPPLIQQAPLVVPSILPGTRIQIYAILRIPADMKNNHMLPIAIKIRGVVTTTGNLVELVVPVSPVLQSPSGLGSSSAFLHALAAKALIRDREQGKHAFPTSISASFETSTISDDAKAQLKGAYLEKDIVRLGTDYGLASKHTSFVAVDLREQKVVPASAVSVPGFGSNQEVGTSNPRFRNIKPSYNRYRDRDQERDKDRGAGTTVIGGGGRPGKTFSVSDSPSPSAMLRPTSLPTSSITSQFHTLERRGPLEKLSSVAGKTMGRPSQKHIKVHDNGRGLRLTSAMVVTVPHTIVTKSAPLTVPHTIVPKSTPLTGSTLIAAIARLQQWHGGFLLTTNLLQLLGKSLGLSQSLMSFDDFQQTLKNHGFDVDRERNVGATLLALVWMEKYGGEEVLDLREKTIEWLNEEVGQDRVRVLKEEIIRMLGSAVSHRDD